MYTDISAPDHLAFEVVDNSVDEALAGHAKRIEARLCADGSFSVRDDGRGIPVDAHPELGLPGAEVIFTTLHAGGKFSGRHYRRAGGLHGVGVSVVNALSRRLEVRIRRGRQEHFMSFENGEKRDALRVAGKASGAGTEVRFWPDPQFFERADFSARKLRAGLRAKAALAPGLRVLFEDERDGAREEWHYEDGLEAYFQELLGGRETLFPAPVRGRHASPEGDLDWCVNWTAAGEGEVGESYVNLVPTPSGGSHVAGLRAGLARAMRGFMDYHNLSAGANKGVKLTADDVCRQLCYVLSLKIEEPHFAGQTKEKLMMKSAEALAQSAAGDAFALWLNERPAEGRKLVEQALANARNRARRAVARKSSLSSLSLPAKLADCSSRDLEHTELFIVEGDSAGGSARQARDRRFQAVMPLRGKILNTWGVSAEDALRSDDIRDLATAIGVHPGGGSLDGLRYGKICVLADADSDGLHIAALLAALFVRHFPGLIDAEHVYMALPPLFRIDADKQVYYARDESDRDAHLASLPERARAAARIMRFKGLGEMNPRQLKESTLAVEHRRLVRLAREDAAADAELFDKLFSKTRAADRRAWLEERGALAENLT